MAAPASNAPNPGNTASGRRRRGTSVSSVAQSVVSATERVLDSDLPPGFLAATAEATSKAPTIGEIRSGALAQPDTLTRSRSASNSRRHARLSRGSRDSTRPTQDHEQHASSPGLEPFPPLAEEPTKVSSIEKPVMLEREETREETPSISIKNQESIAPLSHADRARSSGYIPPQKLPWTTSTANALVAFWKWFITPFGFLVTLYGLNVVAWGGMLFLLLCNASPAMCYAPDPNNPGQKYFNCNDIDSPRRKWIEWDSQILNALFCVTGFGLAPWRFRDLWYLMKYRFTNEKKHGLEKKMYGLRKLGAYYRGWFRLPGQTTLDQMTSQEYIRSLAASSPDSLEAAMSTNPAFDPRLPVPAVKAPAPPLTGVRAPDTKLWKVDFFIWMQVWNTFFQCCLCGFMWGMNRYDRPSWSTGLFVALACGVAGIGGLVSFLEGKAVKRVEGQAPPGVAEQTDEEVDLTVHRIMTGSEAVEPKMAK
ncbi:hypothetical protein CKM354_000247300 [Cercospora kikuchii]|uniref:Uncharacterized protein n=1 Tax=Cercospora kikuchii TaxID=84275 RepID=A0A9P3CCY7_9PEZI|nr:uncharacterized protein CKM354_000247300 [Cercospora kikuchii]GIZ39082.1 hypothetical protein CKM354_000247300 [Cercospora kikuchii]